MQKVVVASAVSQTKHGKGLMSARLCVLFNSGSTQIA